MIKINGQEILTIEDGSLQWDGAKDQTTRRLVFNYLYQPITPDIPIYKAKVGERVEWIEKIEDENGQLVDKTLFLGSIESLPYNTDNDSVTVTCVDLLARLSRSKCVGRYKGTLNEISNNICSAFGIKNGINVESKAVLNIVSNGDLTYYDIINECCKIMYERYCLYMDGDTLKLAEHTSQATFEIGKNIRSSAFRSDISELVTKVLIIDDKGKVINSVQNDKDLKEFGLFQEVYNYNKDSKTNIADAKKLLQTVTNEATIVCDNDNKCISGRFITIYEPHNNLKGVFEIQTDSHTIGTDSVMTLEVKYVTGG